MGVRLKQTGPMPGLDSLLMNVLDQVRSIAGDVLHVPAAKLSAESAPESIESWDSVQHLNLVLALESQFGIEFEPEEIDQMKSIGKIASLVERKQQ
jgi:acyl carrier protein